jgi:hypothetical protein
MQVRSWFLTAVVLGLGIVDVAISAPNEWSDIKSIEGRYSLLYLDYVVSGGTGVFHCINDWVINQDDGGVNGGLLANEYNKFNFTLSSDLYEIRIYPDGKGEILINGVQVSVNGSAGSVRNFKSATSWSTSPNLDSKHCIWEFSFEVAPVTVTRYLAHDPPGAAVTVLKPPPLPGELVSGPSQFPHYVDGHFTDLLTLPVIPPVPSRTSQDPVRDPFFDENDGGAGWTITLQKDGGVKIVTRPPKVPAVSQWGLIALALLLPAAGTVMIVRRRRVAT